MESPHPSLLFVGRGCLLGGGGGFWVFAGLRGVKLLVVFLVLGFGAAGKVGKARG